MNASLVMYDVPTKSKLGNPSAFMWRIGARVNLSCWIVPEQNLPRIPVADWRSKGASVEMVRFDENDRDKIISLAREALLRELTAKRAALETGMGKVRLAFDDVATGDTEALGEADRLAYTYSWRARRFLAAAQECALAFDLTADVAHLCNALRNAIQAADSSALALHRRVETGHALPLESVAS